MLSTPALGDPPSTLTVGKKLYELDLQITGVTNYGITMDALLSGQTPPPPQGARLDGAVEGTATGAKIRGRSVPLIA